MKTIIKYLCNVHSFLYFLIGQLGTKENGGISPKHQIMQYHEFFINNISADDIVLDIGCGKGLVTYNLSNKAKKVVGIDILSKSIAFAKNNYRRNNLKFIIGDATSENFESKFDVIVLSNVLEHIEKRKEFLEKIKKISKIILVRVPMINRDWLTIYKKQIGAYWKLDDTHYIEYTIETFKEEIESAGLKINNYTIQFGEIWAKISNE